MTSQNNEKSKESSLANENKEIFEKLEKTLNITIEDIAKSIGRGSRNIYGSYRKLSKLEFYKVLILGTYLLKSKLDLKDIVKAIEFMKDAKGTE